MKIQVQHNPSRGTYWWALLSDSGAALLLSPVKDTAAEANRHATLAAENCKIPVELWPETKGTP